MPEQPQDGHPTLLRQQTVLAKFGELALRSDGLDEILTEACHLVSEALGTDLAKVLELQGVGETLWVGAGVDWQPGVLGVVTTGLLENTSEAYALRTGEPMISSDIAAETRFSYPPFLTENGVRAVANVVIIGGKGWPPFGVLQTDSRMCRQFTGSDTAFLGSYANQLAAAVDRLRVLAEVRDGKNRLQFALEAGDLGGWQFDLVGGVTCTPWHDRIFGYAGPPLAGRYDLFLGHVLADDRSHVADTFRSAVATGTEWHVERRIQRAGDNAVRWIEVRGRLAGARDDGAPVAVEAGVAGLGHDDALSCTGQVFVRAAADAKQSPLCNRATTRCDHACHRLPATRRDYPRRRPGGYRAAHARPVGLRHPGRGQGRVGQSRRHQAAAKYTA